MSDFILAGNDIVNFLPNFGSAVVTVIPGTIIGTGARCKALQKPFCVQGDEKSVVVPGCPYISGPYSTPGVGMLKIMALAPDQMAVRTKSAGKPVLLKGQMFDAIFEVVSPAIMPGPPPDTRSRAQISGRQGNVCDNQSACQGDVGGHGKACPPFPPCRKGIGCFHPF